MKKYIYYNMTSTATKLKLLFITMLMLSSSQLFADGSKDLYPNGVAGYRAFLRSSTVVEEYWPFPNSGTHYVYAKAGEVITLASSAQNGGTGRIRLYNPSGAEVINNQTAGQISNRTAELAGPQLVGQTGGNRYTPIYYDVTEDGIYRVEFVSRGTGAPSTTVNANVSWTQGSNAGIAAWDVSVINTSNSGFISGRIYTSVLNLSNGTSNPNTNGFNGIIFVLTKDGYTYKVNNNGNNGLYFTFLVNNNGFIDTNGDPIYRSLNTVTGLGEQVHNPNNMDTAKQVTHKLFYTLPATDLPATASGAVPGGSTWLKNTVVEPDVTGVQIIGVDGTIGQMSNKGGYVRFTAGAQGNYTVIIESTDIPASFATRTLSGSASAGVNNVFWDGYDGNNDPLPVGNAPVRVTVQLQGAEVHFPYLDMEYNRFGTVVELLDHTNLNNVVSDIVYWNDTGISAPSNGSSSTPVNNSHLPPTSSVGISSNTNGHIWGIGGSGVSGQFGDSRSIDTWTFIEGEAVTINTEVVVKVADLMITETTADKTTVSTGDNLTYTVKVKNDGPSDIEGAPFAFTIPVVGLDPQSFTFSGNGCGTQSVVLTYNPATHTYSSQLDLPNGCEITYTITVTVTAAAIPGDLEVQASILRPNDVTDPDATNPNPDVPPTDAQYECTNNGQGGICNNILNNIIEFLSAPICTEPVAGENFNWNFPSGTPSPVTQIFTQPPTDYGFVLDIYTLDNSFNMEINGVNIAAQEIEFQSSGTSGINVRFADGDEYETDTEGDIWEMEGDADNPLIRVVIGPSGTISLFGSKVSGGPLFPIELFSGNSLNTITWNSGGTNTIVATQNVVGVTSMSGSGYGLNIVPCHCIKPGALGAPDGFTKVGILTKEKPTVTDWPESIPNGHIVLDSAEKGLVITHMTTAQRDLLAALDGMIIYNADLGCVQLYRGSTPGVDPSRTGWNCIKRGCNE